MNIADDVAKGFELAKKAKNNAYAPFSNFHVGCAIKAKGIDDIKSGCNVENIAYPSSMCAERVCIYHFFPKYRDLRIEWLLIVTDSENGDCPCGGCIQVISEFAEPETPIYIANNQKVLTKYLLKDLRPVNFENPILKK